MSAWVVEREHVDVMLRYGMSKPSDRMTWFAGEPDEIEYDGDYDAYMAALGEIRRELNPNTADKVGRMLMQENVASVCYRYDDDTADMYEDALAYTYQDPGYTLTHSEALKAVSCFEYQACEHPGWRGSEAQRFCEALRDRACSALASGPWGWDKDELAKRDKSYPIFRV